MGEAAGGAGRILQRRRALKRKTAELQAREERLKRAQQEEEEEDKENGRRGKKARVTAGSEEGGKGARGDAAAASGETDAPNPDGAVRPPLRPLVLF
jgi:hypothetical protein